MSSILSPCRLGAGIETYHVADEVVRRLTSTVTPQGIVGVAGFLDVGLGSVLEDRLQRRRGVHRTAARGP